MQTNFAWYGLLYIPAKLSNEAEQADTEAEQPDLVPCSSLEDTLFSRCKLLAYCCSALRMRS